MRLDIKQICNENDHKLTRSNPWMKLDTHGNIKCIKCNTSFRVIPSWWLPA